MDALDEHLDQLGVPHAVINGKASLAQRDRITRDYQDGTIAVILANIVAAGVAVTLARGSDALFVETEWLPDLVSHAVDRQHRIAQERTVMVTAMVAPGRWTTRSRRSNAPTSMCSTSSSAAPGTRCR